MLSRDFNMKLFGIMCYLIWFFRNKALYEGVSVDSFFSHLYINTQIIVMQTNDQRNPIRDCFLVRRQDLLLMGLKPGSMTLFRRETSVQVVASVWTMRMPIIFMA